MNPDKTEDFGCVWCFAEFNFDGKDGTCPACSARYTYELLGKTERITSLRDIEDLE